MKRLSKMLAAAALAGSALVAATPAAAQVQGRIATADVSAVILGTSAFQTASSQINTTYAAQIQQLQTKQQELAQLLTPFDVDNNGQFSESEQAAIQSSANVQQIQTLRTDISSLTGQVNGATIFAVEQILARYSEAVAEVIQQQQIVLLVSPEVVQFIAEGGDISQQVSTALNTKIPSVQIVPPADWRPTREGAQVTQTIQQMLVVMRQRQAAQAAQQGQQQTAAPAGR